MFMRLAALVLTVLVAPTACAQSMVERFQEGTHYARIDPPVAATAPAGKVEVVEVFNYACPHCATFQADVDRWRAKAPAGAHFTYLPAAWSPTYEAFARAYYASETLGILTRAHEPMFKALHTEHVQVRNLEELAQWYTQFGVTKEQFIAAFESAETTAKIGRSRELVPAYKVDGTPSMIVAGKYRVTGEMACAAASSGTPCTHAAVFDVVDFLVAKELAAAKR